MTKALSETKKRELRAIADAIFDSVMAVEMVARKRAVKGLESEAVNRR